jgi:transposase-like protein
MRRVSDEEREKIVAFLKVPNSIGKTALEFKRSKRTISRIAHQEGAQVNVYQTKKATEARLAYAEERRLEIIGKGFDKANELLEKIADAGELQKWSIALGTLVDKARLETGEATTRSEQVDPERRKKMRESLDEVAAKRRERDGSSLAG